MSEPKWLEIARTDLGVEEIAGPRANPRIMAYYKAGHANWAKDDSVPWCGAAMAAWVSTAGLPVPSEAARARAWLDWGVPLEQPKKGAIAVFRRGTDEQSGHVTLYLEDRGDRILCLGGNQGNAVSITSFPKRDVIGYRWPAGVDVPKGADASETPRPPPPLHKSRTIWAALAGMAATLESYFDTAIKLGADTVARLSDFAPLKQVADQIGGNAKALAMGLGVFAMVSVVARRIKTATESKS